MKNITYVKLGIDLLMAVTFVLFFNKQVLGGLTFHEMAGLSIAIVFFTHVLLNWQWVKKVTVKLFDHRLSFKKKFSYFLNLLLLISMAFIIISGIFISRVAFPTINIENEPWFKISHISISYIVLILVAAHIGLHWQWIINIFKNMVTFKTPNPSLGIVAKVATVALLGFGIYQMYSTNFIMRLEGVASVFNLSSSPVSESGFNEGERPSLPDDDFNEGKGPNFPGGDLNEGERPNFQDGDFKGRDGKFESPSALGVIFSYFGIMSVFIIIIYYIEKLIMKKKRNKKQTNFKEEDLTSV